MKGCAAVSLVYLLELQRITISRRSKDELQGWFPVQGKLMTSWAVVCDVYFLEPQKKGKDESAQQFAERVQRLIAERAKLQIAPWDGYLKYYTLGVKVSTSGLHHRYDVVQG